MSLKTALLLPTTVSANWSSNYGILFLPRVSDLNWDHRREQGYRWDRNIGYPLISGKYGINTERYLIDLVRKYGRRNVLIGDPLNPSGNPDDTYYPHQGLIGVYVREGRPKSHLSRLLTRKGSSHAGG